MNIKFLIRFAVIWALNSTLIFLANSYYPSDFVLGNSVLSPINAGIFSGFLLTVFCRLVKPLVRKFGFEVKGRYKMFAFYWLVNSVGIWLIARIAPFSGLGITAFYWAFALGFVASLVQWLVRQVFKATHLLQK